MAFGDGSKSRFAYIAESAFGTTPSTPTFKEIRRTGGAIEPRKQTVRSGHISLVRDIRAELLVGQSVGGNIPFEFNNGNFDDFLEAVLGGTWATNVLKTGNTQRWFTFEETIPVGATTNYHRFTGCALNSLSLDIPMRGLITSSIDIMGKQASAAATSIVNGPNRSDRSANISGVVARSSTFGLGPRAAVCWRWLRALKPTSVTATTATCRPRCRGAASPARCNPGPPTGRVSSRRR